MEDTSARVCELARGDAMRPPVPFAKVPELYFFLLSSISLSVLNFDILNELNFQTLFMLSIMETKTFYRALR